MNVATRSSPETPRSSSACASWAARAPTAAYVSRLASSPVHVATVAAPCTVAPCSRIRLIDRGSSCMVARTPSSCPPAVLPASDAASRLRCCSEGAVPREDDAEGTGEDHQVERRGPALDVVEVELHALRPARLLAPRDLPEAGQARLGQMAALVEVIEEVGFLQQHRARSDDRHTAGEHVEELGELVQRPAPQEPAQR